MLRVSANKTETEIDVGMVIGQSGGNSELEFGEELMRFAGALASGNEAQLDDSRAELLDIAGPTVLVDAAGVAANFQRMVRIADAMGIPVDTNDNEMSNQLRADLGLHEFRSAENSTTKP
jgi:hypothetical protein